MIFPNATPEQTAYLLNLNNQLNEKDHDYLTLNIMDFDINKPEGGGEITTKQTYPFPVGVEIYVKIQERKGLANYYRIYRFKPLLFKIDTLILEKEEKEVIERYETVSGKNLFTKKVKAISFLVDKDKISYVSEVATIAEVLPILFNRWDNQIGKNRYNKILYKFLATLYVHPSFLNWEGVEKWYKDLKFY